MRLYMRLMLRDFPFAKNYTSIKGKKQYLSLSFRTTNKQINHYGQHRKERYHHHHYHFEKGKKHDNNHATCCFSYGSRIYSGCGS